MIQFRLVVKCERKKEKIFRLKWWKRGLRIRAANLQPLKTFSTECHKMLLIRREVDKHTACTYRHLYRCTVYDASACIN